MPSVSFWTQLCGIALGAILGAWARWGLGLWLNSWPARVQLGTLAANVLGGLMIGAVLAYSEQRSLSDFARLFLVTGFLGALTTFSTFSAESLQLALRKDFFGMLLHSALHLMLSVGATAASFSLFRQVFDSSST